MIVGYARVSTPDQSLDLQRDALRAAGCDRIYEEHASGARSDRPQLAEVMRYLREGDTLVVWRLDRLGRSLSDLLRQIEDLGQRGIKLRSLTEEIDTGSAMGRLVLQLTAALSEFERALTRERVMAGLAAMRARGRHSGPKPKLTAEQRREAQVLYDSRQYTMREIAAKMHVHPTTIYRAIQVERRAE